MTALLVAAMTLLFSFQSLFCKLFSLKNTGKDAAETSSVFSITYGAFAGLVTLALAGFRFAPSKETLLLGLFNAAMLLLYNTAMIQASRTGSYSLQMISSLFGGIALPMLHEVLFLGGKLSVLQLAAIGMMLAAFVLMNLKGLGFGGHSGQFLFWCGALFVSNGLFGVLMNLQQRLSQGAERNEMVILTYLGMAVVYGLLQMAKDAKKLKASFRIGREALLYLLLCCISATCAAHLMLHVLNLVDATVLYTIDNGGVLLLSVLYSRVLFRERLTLPQGIGVLLSIASIVMLSL